MESIQRIPGGDQDRPNLTRGEIVAIIRRLSARQMSPMDISILTGFRLKNVKAVIDVLDLDEGVRR